MTASNQEAKLSVTLGGRTLALFHFFFLCAVLQGVLNIGQMLVVVKLLPLGEDVLGIFLTHTRTHFLPFGIVDTVPALFGLIGLWTFLLRRGTAVLCETSLDLVAQRSIAFFVFVSPVVKALHTLVIFGKGLRAAADNSVLLREARFH
jgi:hypothetical protein